MLYISLYIELLGNVVLSAAADHVVPSEETAFLPRLLPATNFCEPAGPPKVMLQMASMLRTLNGLLVFCPKRNAARAV